MAFNLSRFLSCYSVETLQSHFTTRYPVIAECLDWTLEPEQIRTSLERAVVHYQGGRADLIATLERVHLLATEAGDRAMTAACGMDLGLRRALHERPNPHERAIWLLDQQEAWFDRAEEIRDADSFWGSGRRWTGFIGPLGRWPILEGEALELFKGRVETTFRSFDGSGANMVIQSFERGATHMGRQGEGRLCQIAVYLEGLPSISMEFSDIGIVQRSLRPAIEVALVYVPDTGAIDVVAQGGKELREAVARAFVEELFPANAQLAQVRLRQVDLAGLAVQTTFPVDPEDGIKSVRLVLLRLAQDRQEGRITVEVGAKAKISLHDLTQNWFGASNPLRHAPMITKVKLAIQFEPRPGQRRGRSLPVELTQPHGCNLRDRSDQERLVGEKYLRRWNLVRDL